MARPITIRDEHTRRIAIDFLTRLNIDGKEWDVTVERHAKKRTLPQNALMHKWFQTIAEETGNSIEDVKEFYRNEFLGQVLVSIGGVERMVGRSTTSLDTKEMTDFMDKILAHANSELGIVLPLPFERGREAA